jgi:hypothetical protein
MFHGFLMDDGSGEGAGQKRRWERWERNAKFLGGGEDSTTERREATERPCLNFASGD